MCTVRNTHTTNQWKLCVYVRIWVWMCVLQYTMATGNWGVLQIHLHCISWKFPLFGWRFPGVVATLLMTGYSCLFIVGVLPSPGTTVNLLITIKVQFCCPSSDQSSCPFQRLYCKVSHQELEIIHGSCVFPRTTTLCVLPSPAVKHLSPLKWGFCANTIFPFTLIIFVNHQFNSRQASWLRITGPLKDFYRASPSKDWNLCKTWFLGA